MIFEVNTYISSDFLIYIITMEYYDTGIYFVIGLSYMVLSKINIISIYKYLHQIMDHGYI